MKHVRVALWTVVAALGASAVAPLSQQVQAFPEPAVVSPSWNLDLQVQQPRPIAIADSAGNTRWYWYMPYRVTNRTESDQLFVPEVTIYTDRGQIIRAGQDVPANVFPAVARAINNPLLESPIQIVGRLLQGEDYARESVAIWPHFGGDVDEFTVFFAGISGETRTVHNHLTSEPVLVRRTRMFTFRTPGNYPTPQAQPVILEDEREVMR